METTELTSADYWESDSLDLRLNPRRRIEAEGLVDFLREDCGISGSVVLATSGSSGVFKFVVLSKDALLASAQAVVNHCEMTGDDVSLAGLSGFHVGGLGIFARACVTCGKVVDASERIWDREGKWIVEMIECHQVTQTSLTPTHLHDLVSHRVAAPGSLRCVLLGGGKMDSSLISEARELGWPVRVSYGMTEAASQVATAIGEEVDRLPILDCWQIRSEPDGRLSILGEPLFSGYALKGNDAWTFESGKTDDGWFVTGDRCEVEGDSLRFLGRADDLVKISGELVSLSEVDSLASALAREWGADAAVVALPDGRRGNELVAILEASDTNAAKFFDRLNRELDGIEAVSRIVLVGQLPRTPIGKLDRAGLREIAAR